MQTPEAKRARKAAYMRRWRKNNPDAVRSIERKSRGIVDAPRERVAGPCAICGEHADPLQCDHDRTTGLFRGWLCGECNLGLGKFKDSAERLQKAMVYLGAA